MSDCTIDHRKPGRNGYVSVISGGKYVGMAHRIAYEDAVGPIPDGLVIDHLCRTKNCVNPEHLEPVTQAENVRRGYRRTGRCVNGHEMTEENTYHYHEQHHCRTCRRQSQVRRRQSA